MQGMIEMVMPACSMPQSVPPRLVCCRAAARISGRVKLESLFMMTSAARSSFQEVMKAKSATVMIAGTIAGRNMRTSTCQLLQPSITAASSSSRGTASKALRMT